MVARTPASAANESKCHFHGVVIMEEQVEVASLNETNYDATGP